MIRVPGYSGRAGKSEKNMIALYVVLAALLRNDQQDRAWARRIAGGDRQAFAELFDAYAPSLLSYLASRGVDGAEAEDMVQQAFLTIWEKRDALDASRSLRSFLFTIAYRRMLNHFRDQKHTVSETVWVLESSEVSADRLADNRQLAEAIQAAVETMPERRRRVFELCYLEEFTLKESAEILGIKAKTVENHLALALRDLRAELKEYHNE